MADSGSDYQVGPGRPLPTRFKKGQSGNRGGRSAKSLPALSADARNERTFVTIDGRRRKITKREAIVTQMVDESASADPRATKMLIDMMKDLERKAGVAAPPLELRRLSAEDKEVVQLFGARLRRQIILRALGQGIDPYPRSQGFARERHSDQKWMNPANKP